jgi:large subunit ribosomal protein L10
LGITKLQHSHFNHIKEMTREEKAAMIEDLHQELTSTPFFYLTDSSTLSVAKINSLRRLCFERGIKMMVAKNTLIRKALEQEPESKGYAGLFDSLHGPTTILISENPKAPALLLDKFRQTEERPLLKAAYIDSSIYVGDEQLKPLTNLKSKEEMIGEIIGILQSPSKRIASQLTATGSKLAGILKTLEERG